MWTLVGVITAALLVSLVAMPLPAAVRGQDNADQGNFTCIDSGNQTGQVCPGLIGVSRPSNLPDVIDLYPIVKDTICHTCGSRINSDFLCGIIYNMYQPCSIISPVAQDQLCNKACTDMNMACQQSSLNSTVISDCTFLPTTGCNSNNGKNICAPTPWLLRSTPPPLPPPAPPAARFGFGASGCFFAARRTAAALARLRCLPARAIYGRRRLKRLPRCRQLFRARVRRRRACAWRRFTSFCGIVHD
jgi:hypothetical protein